MRIPQKPGTHILLAFLASLAILFAQSYGSWQEVPYADEVTYQALGLSLYDTGVYTDATWKGVSGREGPNGEGMHFAPLYPAMLTVLMKLSPEFLNTARCVVINNHHTKTEKNCMPLHINIMIVTQILLMALGTMCVWVGAYAITNHLGAAWIAMLFTFTGKDYMENAVVSMSEGLILPLFSFAMMAAILAWKKRSALWSILCGLAFGLLCLSKPSFQYAIYFFVPVLLAISLFLYAKRKDGLKPLALVLLFTAVCAATIAPWVIRNGTKIGIWNIAYGLESFTFPQRIAFNDMTWTEFGTSFVYGLPSFGDNICDKIFPEKDCIRHDFGNPDGFYRYGNVVFRPETLEKAGSHAAHFPYLLEHYFYPDIVKHVIVTFSLVWRGMWVGGKLGLIAIPAMFAFGIVALRRQRWDFLFYAAVPLFMLGFHAFVSVNVARYNLIMMPMLGITFAWTLIWAWRKWKTKNPAPLPGLEPPMKEQAV